ncbi:MAG TPA: hypothetical protein VGK16_11850 [Candidatus Limnocylindrales bacterium]|jgi:hypothetical protein
MSQSTAPVAPIDRGRIAWMGLGIAALVGGTLLGWNGDVLTAIATPPALARAALVGAGVVVALALLAKAVRRIEEGRHLPPGELSGRDLALLIRGVRYIFLSVAALAAAAGWLLGSALPFVVALIIAGVDVLETSFLLLVVALRREG